MMQVSPGDDQINQKLLQMFHGSKGTVFSKRVPLVAEGKKINTTVLAVVRIILTGDRTSNLNYNKGYQLFFIIPVNNSGWGQKNI
jgi:hypothetical protein